MQSTTKPGTRLTLEKDEIRILTYDSALSQSSGHLACQTRILRLIHINDGETLPYAALSYVWGDPTVTKPLVCDGTTIWVTYNLWEALSTIWKAYPLMELWADALSITQDNLVERNHQVSLMGDIFRSASHVFVSLGPALRGRNRFWALLQSFASRGDFDSEEFEDQLDDFMESLSNETDDLPNQLAMGFYDFIQRPWFRRAWTYQEIRLATAAVVVCGDSFMPWNSFVESLEAFNKKGAFLRRFATFRTFLKEQAFMFKATSALEAKDPKPESTISPRQRLFKKPLFDLLVDGWPRDAGDARDKIYAFTSSHLSSTSYAELRPDYSLDMRSTFIRFIRIYINNEDNLDFLKFARGIDEPVDLPETGVLRGGGHWIPLLNRDRVPSLERIEPKALTGTSGSLEDSSKFSQTEALPSWICDWRMQGLRKKVDAPPGLANEHYFDVRGNIPPARQSIHDFAKRLVFKGCALARAGLPPSKAPTTLDDLQLGTFTRLPRCALQKALGQSSESTSIPRQSLLFDLAITGGSKNPPSSNMDLLLLQTLLHDQIDCDCTEPPDLDLLKAHCPYSMFPRSCVCDRDWLFLLDGLPEPVILRPHIIPGDADMSRSEIGFDFVSVCPLTLTGAREKWEEAPFAYGQAVLY